MPDFLLAEKASGGLTWYAVELERPQAKMFKKNGDPSADLTHALRQISDWRDWLSHNRDYAARPREQSGLGLIGIDPELEGLIIIGRDSDIDESTTARRRRWARNNRVEIETYDWLLSQARERLAAWEERIRISTRSVLAATMDALFSNSPQEQPAKKAVNEVFGGVCQGWADTSLGRGEIEWEGVGLWPDAHPDDNGIAPLQIIYARRIPVDKLLGPNDWEEWIEHVTRNLNAKHSLLITEIAPTESLKETLTLERDGIWYASEWLDWRSDEEPWLSRLDVLVHLPPAVSYDEKKGRVGFAREVFQRFIALDKERELERERKAQLKLISLSLTPGDRVEHDKFGLGTVQSTSGAGTRAEAIIDFGEEIGVKHLILRYAPLKKL